MSRKDRDIVSTEAVRERKAVRQPRSGEKSRGNDGDQLIDEEGEIVSVVIHKLKSTSISTTTTAELAEKFKSLKEALTEAEGDDEHNAKPKIEKIPFMLQHNENFKKYLNPRVVAIGPFHAKDEGLQVTKWMKLKLAALFIKECGMDKNLLYEKILEKIADFKGCYVDEATEGYNNEDLAWIFLVDGCALLHYMNICGSDQKKEDQDKTLKQLKIKKDHMAFVQQDVFLLNNQLPYELLELLMGLSNKHEKLKHSLEKFILDSIHAPRDLYEANKLNYQKVNKPHHLLDLLRKTLIIQPVEQDPSSFRGRLQKISKVLNLMVERLTACKNEHGWHSFRNIVELKAAGIRLKPSKTSSMRSFSFSWGTLKIPPIIVDDSTAAKLLNMAAYEMCPDFDNEFEVSTFICFLDKLIDRPQDVKALRESGILHNALASDNAVAKLFNEISTDLVSVNEMYSDLQQRIQKHYDNIWINWIAQFISRHFQSPWSVLAFTAAIIALASSIVQTVYTVKAYEKSP
ncbi:hypothetical protein Dsin_013098 [Dipteronia sinensis]|uniref:Uncharacterized protein n=1 Tax=Dipteronia sinensis TaxID=43782 RepID=A0AAE0E8K1_9ROSI|nr:hypothetical protein Dsin_013098 [Dipteronia sinensis]